MLSFRSVFKFIAIVEIYITFSDLFSRVFVLQYILSSHWKYIVLSEMWVVLISYLFQTKISEKIAGQEGEGLFYFYFLFNKSCLLRLKIDSSKWNIGLIIQKIDVQRKILENVSGVDFYNFFQGLSELIK